MDENEFWIKLWKIAAVCFCVVILTTGGCQINKANKIADAVSRGENPIAASCMYQRTQEDSLCITYILSVKK